MTPIAANVERVRERIRRAASAAGRDPSEVRLMGVTKGVSVDRIREAVAAGVTEIGESRVQEAREKRAAFGLDKAGGPRWHLIGHLQRNKAGLAAQLFDVIHSVDSLELVQALERLDALRQACPERRSSFDSAVHPELVEACPERSRRGERPAQDERRLEALIQVNVSGEAAKHGCRPDQAEVLAEALLKAEHLRFAGWMTIAPYSEDPEDARPVFRRLRELRDRWQEKRSNLRLTTDDLRLHLSMGMSQDFEVAIQEGATMVRIGTAIFGEHTR